MEDAKVTAILTGIVVPLVILQHRNQACYRDFASTQGDVCDALESAVCCSTTRVWSSKTGHAPRKAFTAESKARPAASGDAGAAWANSSPIEAVRRNRVRCRPGSSIR